MRTRALYVTAVLGILTAASSLAQSVSSSDSVKTVQFEASSVGRALKYNIVLPIARYPPRSVLPPPETTTSRRIPGRWTKPAPASRVPRVDRRVGRRFRVDLGNCIPPSAPTASAAPRSWEDAARGHSRGRQETTGSEAERRD